MSVKEIYSVEMIEAYHANAWFINKHYAKRPPITIKCFGLFKEKKLIGVCNFGPSPNPHMNSIIEGYTCMELNRLIINEGEEKNTLSFFVSTSLKMLDKPAAIVSYADSGQKHHGYIYQATNWIYTGLSEGNAEFSKNGKKVHPRTLYSRFGSCGKQTGIENGYEVGMSTPKHRYFYFLGNKKEIADMKRKLTYPVLPYPKGENGRYDASYAPKVPFRLF
jgi:hypothetical protein